MLFEEKARNIIDTKTLSLELIEKVIPWNCVFNYKCQMNAVDFAIKNWHKKLAMVMYKMKQSNHWSIHFINIDEKWEYIDNTIWVWANKTKYRLIKIIYEDEFYDIDDIFENYRLKINLELPFYIWNRIDF